MSDWEAVALGLLMLLLIVAGITFGIWSHFAAPCDSWFFQLGTASDLPARCITH